MERDGKGEGERETKEMNTKVSMQTKTHVHNAHIRTTRDGERGVTNKRPPERSHRFMNELVLLALSECLSDESRVGIHT